MNEREREVAARRRAIKGLLAHAGSVIEISEKDIERFHGSWQQDPNSECRIWQKCKNKDGYGMMKICRKLVRPHRLAYALCFGDPGKLYVLHTCDVPACVFPGHLFRGTQADNVADRQRKNRQAKGEVLGGEANGSSKLRESEVRKMRTLYQQGISVTEITAQFSVNQRAIFCILSGKTWGWLK